MLKVPVVCTKHYLQNITPELLSLLPSTVTSHGTTTVERIEEVWSSILNEVRIFHVLYCTLIRSTVLETYLFPLLPSTVTSHGTTTVERIDKVCGVLL